VASAPRTLLASDDKVVCERCVVAESFLTRLRGLLGRSVLPRGEGLLIVPCGSVHTWFMRFPIDVVFLDRDLRVVGVAADVRPWRLRWRKGGKRVLELAAGQAAARGIGVGDRLALADGVGAPTG
jgi:uncharacterized membrane protein (UPF0127 family)